jgi:hypothetical protein
VNATQELKFGSLNTLDLHDARQHAWDAGALSVHDSSSTLQLMTYAGLIRSDPQTKLLAYGTNEVLDGALNNCKIAVRWKRQI